MIGTPSRAAVQVGGQTVRIAAVAADGEPWLVAEWPAAENSAADVLSALFEPGLDQLVVVHPPGWTAERVAACAQELAGRVASRVDTVSTPQAAAVGPGVVLDVGHTGTEVARLAADGEVLSCRVGGVGGALLDEVVADWLRDWTVRAASTASSASTGLVGSRQHVPPGSPSARSSSNRPSSAGGSTTGRPAARPSSAGVSSTGAPITWPPAARSPAVDRPSTSRPPRGSPSGPRAAAASAECPATAPPPEGVTARWVRESLSLLPIVKTRPPGAARQVEIRGVDLEPVLADALAPSVGLLVAELGEGPSPVLLIGGVARAPLLAELVDAAGCPNVVVADRPDAAAVLGALRSPVPRSGPAPGRDPPRSQVAPAVPPTWFPHPRRRPLRAALGALGGAGVAAGLLWIGVALFPPGTAAATASGVLVQYGYRLDVPAGWEHTGGLPERRRVLLTPAATPEGREVIAVERTPIGYDTDAERSRALAELRAEFDTAVAGGSNLSGFRVGAAAGRPVVRYEQQDPDGYSAVDWYVVLDGDTQFSVGCRHNPRGPAAARAACALVVGSVRRNS